MVATHAAPSTLPLPQDNHHKRPRLSAATTSIKAPRGEGRLESGKKGARDQAASVQTSDLDLAWIRAAEYERLRPERETGGTAAAGPGGAIPRLRVRRYR